MERGVDNHDNLIQVGATYARDIHALCSDVSAIVFQSAIVPVTEAMKAAVSSKLRQLVSDIEAQLTSQICKNEPKTWEMLAQSGFLREADLIDFMLARVAEDRLSAVLGRKIPQLSYDLFDHPDGNVADAAQLLLAADSLHRQGAGHSYLDLPPELLHKLCWRVVAALEVIMGERQSTAITAARHIIARYSEGNRAQAAAAKIVHFLPEAARSRMVDPREAGLHLHVANLAGTLGLDHDHMVQLIDAGSSAPYALALKALDVPKSQAIEAIVALRSDKVTPRDAAILDSGYDAIASNSAKCEIDKWAAHRTHFLAFGRP